jgi:hypothetical protein
MEAAALVVRASGEPWARPRLPKKHPKSLEGVRPSSSIASASSHPSSSHRADCLPIRSASVRSHSHGDSDGNVVKTLHPIANHGGVTREAFEAVANEAINDEFSQTNPEGCVDLATLESRLLDGYDTSGTGKERAAPTSGMELKTCAAQLLVAGL